MCNFLRKANQCWSSRLVNKKRMDVNESIYTLKYFSSKYFNAYVLCFLEETWAFSYLYPVTKYMFKVSSPISQPAFTCSKSTMETPEQYVK